MGEPNKTKSEGDRGRDAASLKILGTFFIVLSGFVLLGILWSLKDIPAVIVSSVSGVALLSIGIGMRVVGRKIEGRS